MNLDPIIQAQIDRRAFRSVRIMYVDCVPAIRIWEGIGPLPLAANAVDVEGGVYLGLGELHEVPAFQQLVNGVASRLDFALSGVSRAIVDLADAEASTVRSATVRVGLQFLGDDEQPISTPLWVWTGDADVVRSDRVNTPDGASNRTITLSVGSITTGRRRPRYRYFTKAQQRARSPDDAYCDRVAIYSMDSELLWPPQ